MNKHLIISGIAVLLICVGLSGCTESNNFEITDKVELVSYSVKSYKFGNDIGGTRIELGDGFNYEEDMVGFEVSGIIRNIDDKPMEKIKIIAKFYEDNSNFLGKGSVDPIIFQIPSGDTRDFSIFFTEDEDLLYVDKVEFEFYATYRGN